MNKEAIIELLLNNDRALCRALVVLNNRQTADERCSEATLHANARGWSAAHAKRGTSMANFFTRTGFLTPKQKAWWRTPVRGVPRIGMYAGQLLEEAELKAARKQASIPGIAATGN